MFTINDFRTVLAELDLFFDELLTDNTKIFIDMEIDSIELVGIICYLEENYNAIFSEEDIVFDEEMTVGDFLDLINNRTQ